MGSVAYRIRGGGWFTLGSDTECRLIWGIFGLSLPFSTLMLVKGMPFDTVHAIYGVALLAVAFLDMMIPHAFAQNMGTFGRPWTLDANNQYLGVWKWWPGGWLPFPTTQADWNSSPNWLKTLLDFMGMMSSALVQGLITFGIPILIAAVLAHFGIDIHLNRGRFLRAWAVITVGCPLGYLGGRFSPALSPALTPTACWGEFYTGGVWVLALAQL